MPNFDSSLILNESKLKLGTLITGKESILVLWSRGSTRSLCLLSQKGAARRSGGSGGGF